MDTYTQSQENRSSSQHGEYIARRYRTRGNLADARLAVGLGLFSIVLGMAELLIPNTMGNLIGLNREHKRLLPFMGLREIASGTSILSMKRAPGPVWSRVGGDAVDLAFLGSAYTSGRTDKSRIIVAAIAVLGVAALDLLCAQHLSRDHD